MDYAGLANEWLVSQGYPDLGTTTAGSITERPLEDGRAEVSVVLHTKKASAWAFEIDPESPIPPDVAADPLSFGYRATDLEANPELPPALGESHFGVVFKNTAPGAPLPDLVAWIALGGELPGQELLSLSFRATAFGALRTPFGVADGTPGRMTISQTGLFHTEFHGAVGDGFPAERLSCGRSAAA